MSSKLQASHESLSRTSGPPPTKLSTLSLLPSPRSHSPSNGMALPPSCPSSPKKLKTNTTATTPPPTLPSTEKSSKSASQFTNPSVKDPRLDKKHSLKHINMPFRQSFSTFLADVRLKDDENTIGPRETSGILVTNIPLTATSAQVAAKFSCFGAIKKLDLPKCPVTYANLGIARIVFGDGSLKNPLSAQAVHLAVTSAEAIVIDGATLVTKADPLGQHIKSQMEIESAKTSSNFTKLIKKNPGIVADSKNTRSPKSAILSSPSTKKSTRQVPPPAHDGPEDGEIQEPIPPRPRFDSPQVHRNSGGSHTNGRSTASVRNSRNSRHLSPPPPPLSSCPVEIPMMSRPLHWPEDPFPFPDFSPPWSISTPRNDHITSPLHPPPDFRRYNHHNSSPPPPLPVPPLPKPQLQPVFYCITFESKYLPLFIASEEELMSHFQHYRPKEVTKEQRCWVVHFDNKASADQCLLSSEAQIFRGYHLLGKLHLLDEFRNPPPETSNIVEAAPPPPAVLHKALPSTGLPSFKKYTNSLRPSILPHSASDRLSSSPISRGSGQEKNRHSSRNFLDSPRNSHQPSKLWHHLPDSNPPTRTPSPRSSRLESPISKKRAYDRNVDYSTDQDDRSNNVVTPNKRPQPNLVNNQVSDNDYNSENDDDMMVNSVYYESSPSPQLNGDEPLPVNSSGSARTQGYFPINEEIKKKFQQTFTLSVTGLRRNPQSSHWLPHSAAAREQARAIERGGGRIILARSGIHDWGLFTLVPINKGELVIEYVGELIRSNLADVRERRYLSSGIDSSYLFRVDDEYVVDATTQGNIARFINHSCQPNCLARITRTDNRPRILIFAKMNIPRHQEITYDYQFPLEDEEHKIKCLCNAPTCRGFLN